MLNKFELGRVVATPAVLAALEQSGEYPMTFLLRHVQGDWGELDNFDKQQNEMALKQGLRIMSVYRTSEGTKFYIITEHDRSVTTLLLPEDY